jgi:ubiquinone/menaquinone biosynthesis C-methylase UbiE
MNADPGAAEIQRIRLEYQRRAREIPRDFYNWSRCANQFLHFQTVRAAIDALTEEGLFPLEGHSVADIGCGTGTWMLEFAQWGADAGELCGIDLDEVRVQEARRKLPGADLHIGDARHLPWGDAQFDLVSQITLFTSILSPAVKSAIAAEMLRVVKPTGAILWYDFCVNNPRNASVRGVDTDEIRTLFPGCSIRSRRITLAPPLARTVVPNSWILALMLEKMPFLCTHCLAIIRKTDSQTR